MVLIELLISYQCATRVFKKKVLIAFGACLAELASGPHRLVLSLDRLGAVRAMMPIVIFWHVNITVCESALENHRSTLSVVIRLVIQKLILILIILLHAHLVIATLLLSAGHLRITYILVIRLKYLNASKRYLTRSFLDALQVCLMTVHVT